MTRQRNQISVEWFCAFFGKSRQAYYQMLHRNDGVNAGKEIIINYVHQCRKIMPRIGTRKLHLLLQPTLKQSGIKCGRDRLFSFLGKSDLLIKRKKARRCYTQTMPLSRHFPNLIKNLKVEMPEEVWVSDTTGLPVRDGLGYLTLTTDIYSKQIMGYNLQRTKQSCGALATLRMSIHNRKYPDRQLIHHSDGGGEYFNYSFLQVLKKSHIKVSCTAPSSPHENSVAERINGILKQEFLLVEDARSYDDIMQMLPAAIRIYNEQRPHTSIDMKTPAEAHCCQGVLKRHWNRYQRKQRQQQTKPSSGQQIQELMNSW